VQGCPKDARIATTATLFALAQKAAEAEKDPAFQASSPKTFRVGPLGPARFFIAVPDRIRAPMPYLCRAQ
jgi:hypothetical protein